MMMMMMVVVVVVIIGFVYPLKERKVSCRSLHLLALLATANFYRTFPVNK
jgi:hypothetical protein